MLRALALLWLLDSPSFAARTAMLEQGLDLELMDGRHTVLAGLERICQRESLCRTHPDISARVGLGVSRTVSPSRASGGRIAEWQS